MQQQVPMRSSYTISSPEIRPVISSIVAKILRQLEQRPITAAQLALTIASEFDVDSDQEVVEHVVRLVSDLDELGLVKPFTE